MNDSKHHVQKPKSTERKRNARERRRVQGINDFLDILKDKLPVEWTSSKMSKLEILRKSTSYIKLLMEMSLDDNNFPMDDVTEHNGMLEERMECKEATMQMDTCNVTDTHHGRLDDSFYGGTEDLFSDSPYSSSCSLESIDVSPLNMSTVPNPRNEFSGTSEISSSLYPGRCFHMTGQLSMATRPGSSSFECSNSSTLDFSNC